MKRIASSLVLLVLLALPACKDAPGADGRYAVHDGGNRHGSP